MARFMHKLQTFLRIAATSDEEAYIGEHFQMWECAQRARGEKSPFPKRVLPPTTLRWNLVVLNLDLLDPIRNAVGKAVKTNSVYRSPEYNAFVQGAKSSYHMRCMAADIRVQGWSALRLKTLIMDLHFENKIRLGGIGIYPKHNFVHVDIRPGKGLVQWRG